MPKGFIGFQKGHPQFNNALEIWRKNGGISWNKGKLGYKTKPATPERKEKIRKGNLGKKRSEEAKRKMSEVKKGKPSNAKGKHWKLSKKARENIRQGILQRGDDWRENLSKAQKKKWDRIGRKKYKRYIHLTATPEYKEWRMKVFLRDNFTCQFCGIRGNQIGGYLEAHHNKSWTKYPELRFKVENGITLCKECHKLANKIQRKNGC